MGDTPAAAAATSSENKQDKAIICGGLINFRFGEAWQNFTDENVEDMELGMFEWFKAVNSKEITDDPNDQRRINATLLGDWICCLKEEERPNSLNALVYENVLTRFQNWNETKDENSKYVYRAIKHNMKKEYIKVALESTKKDKKEFENWEDPKGSIELLEELVHTFKSDFAVNYFRSGEKVIEMDRFWSFASYAQQTRLGAKPDYKSWSQEVLTKPRRKRSAFMQEEWERLLTETWHISKHWENDLYWTKPGAINARLSIVARMTTIDITPSHGPFEESPKLIDFGKYYSEESQDGPKSEIEALLFLYVQVMLDGKHKIVDKRFAWLESRLGDFFSIQMEAKLLPDINRRVYSHIQARYESWNNEEGGWWLRTRAIVEKNMTKEDVGVMLSEGSSGNFEFTNWTDPLSTITMLTKHRSRFLVKGEMDETNHYGPNCSMNEYQEIRVIVDLAIFVRKIKEEGRRPGDKISTDLDKARRDPWKNQNVLEFYCTPPPSTPATGANVISFSGNFINIPIDHKLEKTLEMDLFEYVLELYDDSKDSEHKADSIKGVIIGDWLMENGDEKRVKRFNEETYMHFFIRMLELKNRHSYKEIGSSIVEVVFMSNGSHPNESEAKVVSEAMVRLARLLKEKRSPGGQNKFVDWIQPQGSLEKFQSLVTRYPDITGEKKYQDTESDSILEIQALEALMSGNIHKKAGEVGSRPVDSEQLKQDTKQVEVIKSHFKYVVKNYHTLVGEKLKDKVEKLGGLRRLARAVMGYFI
ncbi:hypothetical protein BS50DRAFT_636811 [Corynespora cassiicola Philippines]|uniref:Uncharacterized protein n=1 Tax=Corynespora cassiicola Philippines TaxID=1448308 RepID=A0A2T2NHZ6_CORCC|nr:hypothetical protein BS50DRAFT_636811 [Corynespora cassiicola Philippines]